MRFYGGGSLSEWLSLRADDVWNLLRLADRLEAEERLAHMIDTSMASGWAKKGQSSKHVNALKRQAEPPRTGPKKRQTPQEIAAQLAELGMASEVS